MKDPKDIANSTISLEEAMTRTNNWRQAIKPLFADSTTKVPKGFVIPLEDLLALAEKYRHNEIAGVRAYFTLSSPDFEGTISAILVPVQLVDKPGGAPFYKDLILHSETENDDSTSLYDFTKPCPPSCDEGSELN